MRRLGLFVIVMAGSVLAGCVTCSTEPIDAEVTLALQRFEAHALPILASGATQIAGIKVPDSHGHLRFAVHMAPLASVEVQQMHVELQVDGLARPAVITHVEGPDWYGQDGIWSGRLAANATLRLFWAVDGSQLAQAPGLAIPEGSAIKVTVKFAWRADDCIYQANGRLAHDEDGLVKEAAVASGFRPMRPATLDNTAGAQVTATYRLIEDPRTVLAADVLVLRLGAVPSVAAGPASWTVDGASSSNVGRDQTLEIRSMAPMPYSPPTTSGTEHLVLVHIRHQGGDDRFGYLA